MTDIAPVVLDATFAAPPDAVFDAFTRAEHLTRWFAARARIDATPGGTWRYEWPDDLAAEGRVLDADRPNRLVWTWEASISGPVQMDSDVTITYTFEPDGDGTRLHLEEVGHDTAEIRDANASGNEQMLATLRAYLEDGTTVDWAAPPS
ncbi:SRPBCC family protein [Agilicoccus flavus]|uniref:SRPBCC family protein n=1 Tax=Agilicoccus flavus TaxID=2775968 RepID=UPI001CF69286|nr:SRPBCC domain-containing protein [Agilicoccus flavus]